MLYDKLLERGKVTFQEYKEKKLAAFKNYRLQVFKAYDIYKTNVIYGLEKETAEERQELLSWYNAMKDYPSRIETEKEFPQIPEKISYYLGG